MRQKRTHNLCLATWIALAVIFIFTLGAKADGVGSTGASYLTLPLSAKSIAMGEAGAALDNPFALFYNPALMSACKNREIAISHSEWIIDDRYDNLSGYSRVNDKFVLGGGFTFLYRPVIEGYNDSGIRTEDIKSNNYQAAVGCQFSPTSNISTGLTFKYFREKLGEYHAAGMAVDIGMSYKMEKLGFKAGVAVQNLGPDIKFESINEPIPLTIRIGCSQSLRLDKEKITVTITADGVIPKYEDIFLSTGAEIDLYNILKLRTGYCGRESRPGNGISMGGGINVKDNINLNYAFSPYGDLGSFHRISMRFSK